MERPRISIVVTDLDNTLFDWVDIWHRSFKALLDGLVEESGVPRELLEREFRKIHQRHGTSEYAFSVQELPSLLEKYPGVNLVERFDGPIHAFRSARKAALKLYPTVAETLRAIKATGCRVVAYTESLSFYSNQRVKRLGLDGLLDVLYSPKDHELPSGLSSDDLRQYPPEDYRFLHTEHRHTPAGVRKPSPELLNAILEELGARAFDTIYVGDSLHKDISMAQAIGITAIYARYGDARLRPEYDLLRRVSHWPDETIEVDRKQDTGHVNPTHSIDAFAELIDLFQFGPPRRALGDPHVEHALDVWKQTIDVQQHFNDLELRIRNFAITLLLATLGAAGVALKDGLRASLANVPTALPCLLTGVVLWVAFHLLGLRLIRWLGLAAGVVATVVLSSGSISLGRLANPPLSSLVLLAGLLGWAACYFMDRWWYHRLLLGAVQHGLQIEDRLREVLPEASLTKTIGEASPIRIGLHKVRSTERIDWFYGTIAVVLAIGVVALWGATPSASSRPSGWLHDLTH